MPGAESVFRRPGWKYTTTVLDALVIPKFLQRNSSVTKIGSDGIKIVVGEICVLLILSNTVLKHPSMSIRAKAGPPKEETETKM